MTDKEILRRILKRAINNGYDYLIYSDINDYWFRDYVTFSNLTLYGGDSDTYEEHFYVRDIIFSHDFAKAFWGEEKTNTFLFEYDSWVLEDGTLTHSYEKYYLPNWQYQLQLMILEKQPLKFLEKFLTVKTS